MGRVNEEDEEMEGRKGCGGRTQRRGVAETRVVLYEGRSDISTRRGVGGRADVTAEGLISVRRNARDQCAWGCQVGARTGELLWIML